MRFVYKCVPSGTRREGGRLLLGGPSTLLFNSPLFMNIFQCLIPPFFNCILQPADAYSPYSGGLYSRHAPLVQKRTKRNFHMRTRGYHVRAGTPELRELLEWCPKDGAQIVPWMLP